MIDDYDLVIRGRWCLSLGLYTSSRRTSQALNSRSNINGCFLNWLFPFGHFSRLFCFSSREFWIFSFHFLCDDFLAWSWGFRTFLFSQDGLRIKPLDIASSVLSFRVLLSSVFFFCSCCCLFVFCVCLVLLTFAVLSAIIS